MKQSSFKRSVKIVALIVLLLIIYFIISDHLTPNTGKAYVRNYIAQIAPQVSGQITKIYVHNNEIVKKGQPLFEIDRRPYEYAYQSAEANLENTQHTIKQVQAQISALEANINEKQNDLQTAQTYYDRYSVLAKKGFVSQDTLLDYHQRLIDDKAALRQTQQALIAEQQKLGQESDGRNVHLEQAQAQLKSAKYNYDQTIVRAPDAGKIINLLVTVGNYAQAGVTQFSLVTKSNWWVEANFTENNLHRIELKQTAWVSLSMYPGQIFKAHVSGLTDAVNLTQDVPNNYVPYVEKKYDWVRTPQSFPVQITLDKIPPAIRGGASAYVTVLTTNNWIWIGLAYLCQAINSYWQYIS